MKIDDIIFAIGIIIISALLVFVVYDDTIGGRYQTYMDEYMENNTNDDLNITEKDISLVPSSAENITNNTVISSKTKTANTQSSDGATPTKTSKTKDNSAQSFNSQKNNGNNKIETISQDIKPSSFSNNHNNEMFTQKVPANKKI